MSSIKPRKQLLVIELKDWTILHSEKTLQELHDFMSNWKEFILIDWVMFWKYEFKKAYEKKADDITVYKLSLPDEQKAIIKTREIVMKELGKNRESIEQIQRYLDSKLPIPTDTQSK